MRAGYGKKLRNYLSTTVNTHAVLDFGMAQNFGAATTYTCVIQVAKSPSSSQTLSCYAMDDRAAMANPSEYFGLNYVEQNHLDENPWVVLSKDRQRIKELVEAQGVPLEDWDIQINYGIKTGFNDAFYITQEQRDAFIAEDPACEELLVPLLRGRHIERYKTNWDGTWMIATFPALELKEKSLPKPIFEHLNTNRERLEPKPSGWTGAWAGRKAGSYAWYETQDVIGYHNEFRAPKIVYQEIATTLPFFYDNHQMFMDTTCFMMSSNEGKLGYLTAVLNSSLFRCCFKDNFPEYSGNAYRVKKIFVDRIPIRKVERTERSLFESAVFLVQLAKRISHVSSQFLEDLIDACVMECYFSDHMAERDLLFLDDLKPHLANYDASASDSKQTKFLEHFYRTLNAPDSPIRNRLLRLTADSPDLLAVIKQEGKV